MKHMENSTVIKIGIVVENIEETVKNYVDLFGIDTPAIIVPEGEFKPDPTGQTYTWYRGENTAARAKLANVQMGNMILELLEPLDEPSPYTEFKEKHGTGVQFIGFTINGFEQHIDLLNNKEMPIYLKGEYGSGRYAFFESLTKLGVNLAIQEIGEKK